MANGIHNEMGEKSKGAILVIVLVEVVDLDLKCWAFPLDSRRTGTMQDLLGLPVEPLDVITQSSDL